MKKPVSLMQLVGFVFSLLGPLFLILGYLNYWNILREDPTSKGNPAIVFSIIGVVILLIGIGLFYIPLQKIQKRIQLKANGTKVVGVVTSVRKLSSVYWGSESPFLVRFCYEYEGESYKGRSQLLWKAPTISNREQIDIYINNNNKKQYWVEL